MHLSVFALTVYPNCTRLMNNVSNVLRACITDAQRVVVWFVASADDRRLHVDVGGSGRPGRGGARRLDDAEATSPPPPTTASGRLPGTHQRPLWRRHHRLDDDGDVDRALGRVPVVPPLPRQAAAAVVVRDGARRRRYRRRRAACRWRRHIRLHRFRR